MAGKITFHLWSCDESRGHERRRGQSVASDALAKIRAHPLVEQCACPPHAPPTIQTPRVFSFSLSLGAESIAPLLHTHVASEHSHLEPQSPRFDRCHYVDQYSINADNPATGCFNRLIQLLYGTLFSNVVPNDLKKQTSSLLGPTGHYERFSAWSHIVGTLLFAIYAVARQVFAEDQSTLESICTSVAAWTTALVFMVSALYHATSADVDFAVFTRLLDYIAIYTSLAVGATADIAVATRGFQDIPLVTTIDIPIAATILILFFVWRRARLPTDVTWIEDNVIVPNVVKCEIGRGLFSRGHQDLHHSQMRQATSLLLAMSYFMVVPAAVLTLGPTVATPMVIMQLIGFFLAVTGMALDNVFEWPNEALVEGRQSCCYPSSCGCVLTAHGIWHIVAIVSAAFTVVAREYALASY